LHLLLLPLQEFVLEVTLVLKLIFRSFWKFILYKYYVNVKKYIL